MKHQLLTADKMLTLARHPGRHSDILSERRRRQDSLKSIRELTAQKKKKKTICLSLVKECYLPWQIVSTLV